MSSYKLGYGPRRLALLRQRSAASHAAFLLPHIQGRDRLLDCGCGPGTITVDLASRLSAGALIGLDIADHQVDEARDLAKRVGAKNLSFMQQDVISLTFPAGSFDIVLAHALVEHLADPLAAIHQMWRVLSAGGVLAIRAPDWNLLRMSPPCEAGTRCVDALLSRLASSNVLAEQGPLAGALVAMRPRTILRSKSTETHRPPDALVAAVIDSLGPQPHSGPEGSFNPQRSDIQALSAWGRNGNSRVTETWNELILIKEAGE